MCHLVFLTIIIDLDLEGRRVTLFAVVHTSTLLIALCGKDLIHIIEFHFK